MKGCTILVKENDLDSFSPPINNGDFLMEFIVGHESTAVQSNAKRLLLQSGLLLKANATDLLNFALAIYSVDQLLSRKAYGFQGWSRHLKVYFPVTNASLWSSTGRDIEKMLSFLSGDKWELHFRQLNTPLSVQTTLSQNPNGITKVALFSGGLDSYISAIDLLTKKEKIAFVSHYKNGTERPKQLSLYTALQTKFGTDAFTQFQFYVQPNQKHPNAKKEDSSRARSFLFLVLGISVANALGDHVELIVPENGLISLNVPLTQTRLSSHSTRTTHPFYLRAFEKMIYAFGLNNPIRNPYQFKTKGEMMKECLDKRFLKSNYIETLSCSHPDNSRFIKGTRPGIHCGYCVPCIIRQAAEKAAGKIQTPYAHLIKTTPPSASTKKGRDLRAFQIAVKEVAGLQPHSLVLRVLRSGPLPFENRTELNDYIDVFKRGMLEVKSFLK